MHPTKILIVEDEAIIALNIKQRLIGLGYSVVGIADNTRSALELVAQCQPHLVLMDIHLYEDESGIEAAIQIREQFHCPVVFLTAFADDATIEQAKQASPFGYIVKPFEVHNLRSAIEIALARYQTEQSIQNQSRQQLDGLRHSLAFSLPHEFKTPLNGIVASVDLLRYEADSPNPNNIREVADILEACGNRLYQLVQNFLLYAKLEIVAHDATQVAELRACRTTNPEQWIVDTANQIAQDKTRDADLQLDLQSIQSTPIVLAISENYLSRVVAELVDNAFKFSKPGHPVMVRIRVEGNSLVVEIEDQGRGMTAEQVAWIDAYIQFERPHYEQQGVGLGLAIARRLLQLHGGQLTISSQPEQGTTVRSILPMVTTA